MKKNSVWLILQSDAAWNCIKKHLQCEDDSNGFLTIKKKKKKKNRTLMVRTGSLCN